MKPKTISTHTIPVKNAAREFRFFHEVFDIPVVEHENFEHLILQQERLVLDENAEPTELTLTVKDHQAELANHLASYYVTQVGEPVEEGQKVVFTIKDFEDNTIKIIANK
ncbi:lactoylglutathione lyase [Periweissella cryptocerci]|uniref:Lactoylglutathione lyase n=1 Tax=Periweissella cryptocerci TaxID=2506420 RepID=A0A4P6YUU6_9LACO|nr:lactoylglutathione lyase [Periweissella cryptocerci]QBO36532.1 lactoylglutathione lyase [Periweissella cryptocerci]